MDTHPDVWNKVLAVNLTGTFWGCKTIVPTMLRKGTGSVILLSSISSYMATPALTPYGVSKAGVQHLSRSVAMVGARDGRRVRCNSVHPGVIKTRMTDNIISGAVAGPPMHGGRGRGGSDESRSIPRARNACGCRQFGAVPSLRRIRVRHGIGLQDRRRLARRQRRLGVGESPNSFSWVIVRSAFSR